jgi:hypothetical protein
VVLNHTWRDQWDRVQRRLDDVRAVYRGAPGGTVRAVDSVQSFFESVHHLKDWVGNDSSISITGAEADALINGNESLKISADLANGSKHFTLTRTRTGDRSTDVTRSDVTVFAGTGRAAHKFYVESGGIERDVLDIATAAVDAWQTFLVQRGLTPGSNP